MKNDGGIIMVEGEVRGRRRLSDGLWSVDLSGIPFPPTLGEKQRMPLRCILHDSDFGLADCTCGPLYGALLCSGARARLAGVWAPGVDEAAALLVIGARLLRCSHQRKPVEHLLRLVASGELDALEGMHAVQALPKGGTSPRNEDAARAFRTALMHESVSERGWRAAAIHRTLLERRSERMRASGGSADVAYGAAGGSADDTLARAYSERGPRWSREDAAQARAPGEDAQRGATPS